MKKFLIPILGLMIVIGSFSSFAFAQTQSYGEEAYGIGSPDKVDLGNAPRDAVKLGDNNDKNKNNYSFKIQNPLRKEISSIPALIYELINLAMTAGVYLAVLALIWVGFTFVLAQGNDTKISNAKKALLYVIIGIAILLGSKLIVEVIKNTLSQFNPLLFK